MPGRGPGAPPQGDTACPSPKTMLFGLALTGCLLPSWAPSLLPPLQLPGANTKAQWRENVAEQPLWQGPAWFSCPALSPADHLG